MKERIDFIRLYMNEEHVDEDALLKWTDWKWQMKNTITSLETVEKVLGIKFSDEKRKKLKQTSDVFPLSITP